MRKRPFICLRSFKVIDFGTNGKCVYTFLLVLVNNNNFSHISHRYGDIGGLKAENRQFYLPHPHLTPPLWGTPKNFGIKLAKLAVEKLEKWGYRMVKIA